MRSFQAFEPYFDSEDWCVWVCESSEDGDKRVARLNPHLEVMNKSPTGFAWGYGGSGPSQLAFAILAHVIGVERAKNPMTFQRFKFEVIAKLDQQKGFKITEDEVKAWVKAQQGEESVQ